MCETAEIGVVVQDMHVASGERDEIPQVEVDLPIGVKEELRVCNILSGKPVTVILILDHESSHIEPRHAVFWTPRGTKGKPKEVYLYLVGELNNSLSAFKVTYSGKTGISFFKFYEGSTYGERVPPVGSKAAEIAISPENNHVVVSNRNDNTFGPGNDSFAVFSCAEKKGKSFKNVTFLDLYPAHGSFPRQFSINKEDKMVAVALQNSRMVAVARWDKRTGAPGTLLIEKVLDGEIPAVVWDL